MTTKAGVRGASLTLSMSMMICVTGAYYTMASAAEFLSNRQDWVQLSDVEKSTYVMGLTDGFFSVYAVDDQFSDDASRCLGEMQLSDQTFVDLIETGYRDVSSWDDNPAWIFFNGVRMMCLNRINTYRRERGEPPLNR